MIYFSGSSYISWTIWVAICVSISMSNICSDIRIDSSNVPLFTINKNNYTYGYMEAMYCWSIKRLVGLCICMIMPIYCTASS